MKSSLQFLLIDPQNDFCDLPEAWRPVDAVTGARAAPALPVAGAHADMLRLARLIDEQVAAGAARIEGITVTLDSHHRLHIAHPTFWRTGEGGAVQPFTQITAAQVRADRFLPRDPTALARALDYLDQLEARGRYTLMVWPIHCEIGSWGHNVHPAVKAAYNAWEDAHQAIVRKLQKGSNPWTENYSAIEAEVPDASDPATQFNQALVDSLDTADWIVVAGEAASHCVRATTEHVIRGLPSRRADKVVLVTDCMSAVAGFEPQQSAFFDDMRARGARLVKAADVAALLA